MRKNKKLFHSLIFIIAFGILGSLTNILTSMPNNQEQPSVNNKNDIVSTEITENGIKLVLLSSQENNNQNITKVFGYEITPSDATIQDILIDLKYIDGENCDSVMTYTHDQNNKTITLTCLSDFDKQIKMVLTALDNESATATIVIDYVKKILSINLYYQSSIELKYGVKYDNYGLFDLDYLVGPTYSKYTKDKEYTFKLEATVDVEIEQCSEQFNMGLKELFTKFVQCEIMFPSEEQLWNLCSNTKDKYILSSLKNVLEVSISGDVYCVENPSIVSNNSFNKDIFYADIAYDFSEFKTNVDSIVVNNPSIEF